jgi:hypothetical protein
LSNNNKKTSFLSFSLFITSLIFSAEKERIQLAGEFRRQNIIRQQQQQQ